MPKIWALPFGFKLGEKNGTQNTHRAVKRVAQILGTPSSSATFDDKTWYYIGKTTKRIAFLDPETLESKILVVKFDDQDRLQQIATVDRSQQREVEIVSRESPTPGREKSLLMSLYDTLLRGFGNAGPNRGFEK